MAVLTNLATIESGISTVIHPAENKPDVRHLPDYMQNKLNFVYARGIQEVLEAALVKKG